MIRSTASGLADSLSRSYGYDLNGNITSSGFVYDGNRIAGGSKLACNVQYTPSGGDSTSFTLTYAGNVIYRDGEPESVRAVVNIPAGTIAERDDYMAYDTTVPNTTDSTAFPRLASNLYGFSGKEELNTTLSAPYLDFGARIYDPFTASWLSPDPLAADYPGISPYAYCAGDPMNLVDPNGGQIIPWNMLYKAYAQNLELNGKTANRKTLGYLLQEPIKAMIIGPGQDGYKWLSSQSSNYTINLSKVAGLDYRSEGGYGNALRHTIWQAFLTLRFGENEAARIGAAHESTTSINESLVYSELSDADTAADLLNNEIGRAIGSSSSDKRVVVKMALDVFKNDGLWIAIMASDGLYHIQKAKITEEQHKKALYEFELLNNYGLKKEP